MPDTFDGYHVWLGIPASEQPPNHYRLLGIALFETDLDVIDHAADRQMAHVRTFQAGRHQSLSQQILNELSMARVCLLNTERKTAYDAALRQRLGSLPKAAAVVMGQPPVRGQAIPSVQPTMMAIPRAAPVTSSVANPMTRSAIKPAAAIEPAAGAGGLASNKAQAVRNKDGDGSLDIEVEDDFESRASIPSFEVHGKRRLQRRGPTWQRPAMMGIAAAVAVTSFWLLFVFAQWVSKQNWTWRELVEPPEHSAPVADPLEPHPDTSAPPAPLPAATVPATVTPEP